ncbi:MAG: hypothetical protein KF851_07635 [Pirellulaceae bacterium]|nr:hypothetical protein [Pirellulaceae bacterium]
MKTLMLMMRFVSVLFVTAWCAPSQIIAQETADEIRALGVKIKENRDSIKTWSGQYSIISEYSKGHFYEAAEDGGMRDVSMAVYESEYEFHFDSVRKLLNVKHGKFEMSLFDADRTFLRKLPIDTEQQFVANQVGFYEFSFNVKNGERHHGYLNKKPLSVRHGINQYDGTNPYDVNYFHPNEFFKPASLYTIWDYMDRLLTDDCEISKRGSGLVDIFVRRKLNHYSFVLDEKKGGLPISFEAIVLDPTGNPSGHVISRKWDYVSVGGVWIPSMMELHDSQDDSTLQKRTFTLREGSLKVNEPIDEKLFTEEAFEVRDYDRFYDHITGEEAEFYRGKKVTVSPLTFESREPWELKPKK